MYTCGPTVYRDAHIGNFRTYLFEDLLRRTLKFLGYRVTQVMNLTDVDDKTIRDSRARGVKLKEHTAPIIERFFADLDLLGIERAEYYPAATDHIPEMIALIEELLRKGVAYQAEGNVYFSIAKFPEYGQLSGMKMDGLARGVRINADEYEDKEDFRDFALWKGWTKEDGEVGWDSPFGRGRPGWHIECSAMSLKYLGAEFDIHTGGVDNIFPHHENEIAQSVCALGSRFVRYWMHSAHLILEGEKMSKSLGNVLTLRELVERGESPRVLRYVLLMAHYRQQLNLTDESLPAAQRSLERLDTLCQAALNAAGAGAVNPSVQSVVSITRERFAASLADDLGISGAMAALYDLVSDIHRINRETPLSTSDGAELLAFWRDVDRVLGFLFVQDEVLPDTIEASVCDRLRMRKGQRFVDADKIRTTLATQGFQLEDTKEGTLVIWGKGRKMVIFTN